MCVLQVIFNDQIGVNLPLLYSDFFVVVVFNANKAYLDCQIKYSLWVILIIPEITDNLNTPNWMEKSWNFYILFIYHQFLTNSNSG